MWCVEPGSGLNIDKALENHTSSIDRFEKRYVFVWTLLYLLMGLANTVWDNYWSWHEAIALVLFLITIAGGIAFLIHKHWRKAVSALLALPILWVADVALSAAGIDAKQRSFWLTYPFYAFQVEGNANAAFKWAENGWFLGGGWQYTLLHEPQAYSWNRLISKSSDETQFIIGTNDKFKVSKMSAGDCEIQHLRHLGGHWYLQTSDYGEGLGCG